MPRILLVDDDASLLEVLALAVSEAGHEVETAGDGLAALRVIHQRAPDLMVCDVNMPHLDGFSLCRRLRGEGSALPILLLTSREGEVDETLGLDLGADDYVTKPFRTRVLLARIAVLLRREEIRRGPPTDVPRVQAGALVIDVERLEATYQGKPLTLTVTELRLLEALARRRGIVLARDRILEIVRDDDSVVAERIVDTYVRRLRKKLGAIDPAFEEIETLIGAGYRWRA